MDKKQIQLILVVGVLLIMFNIFYLYGESSKSKKKFIDVLMTQVRQVKGIFNSNQREYILSKQYLTTFEEIEATQMNQAFLKSGQFVYNYMKNKFSPDKRIAYEKKFPFRDISIPFQNSTLKYVFSKVDSNTKKIRKFDEKCVFEPATLLTLSKIVRPNFKIIECGSQFGVYTLKIASLLDSKKGGMLHSIEANLIKLQFANASVMLN